MANDFIKANTANSNAFLAANVVDAARRTRELMDLLNGLIARGYHLFVPAGDGNVPPADFTGFEAACGLDAGEGQVVFDLLNGTLGAMTGTMQNANAVELKNRIG